MSEIKRLIDAVEFLKSYSGYQKKGDAVVAERLSIDEEMARTAKKIAKYGWENENDNTNEVEETEVPVGLLESECKRLGIPRNEVGSVKYWVDAGGSDRLSIVRRDADSEDDRESFRLSILEDIRNEKVPDVQISPTPTSGNFAVFAMPDMHFGKVAPGWSLEEAGATILGVFAHLNKYAQTFNVDENIIPLGHDLLQVDYEHISRSGTLHTTSSLTPVEVSAPWMMQFKAARYAISTLLRYSMSFCDTTSLFVPGNHSHQSEIAMGEVMDAQFQTPDGDPVDGIQVINTGEYEYAINRGDVSIMFAHGHTVKFEELPHLFANAFKEEWYKGKYTEVHTGHKHIKKGTPIGSFEDIKGTTCRISPSLSPQDAWHKKFNFHGTPAAEVFVYNRREGLIGHTIKHLL